SSVAKWTAAIGSPVAGLSDSTRSPWVSNQVPSKAPGLSSPISRAARTSATRFSVVTVMRTYLLREEGIRGWGRRAGGSRGGRISQGGFSLTRKDVRGGDKTSLHPDRNIALFRRSRRSRYARRSQSQPFRAADEVVDDRAEEMAEEDHQHPSQLFVRTGGLFLEAIDEHPDPEREAAQDERDEEEKAGKLGQSVVEH